MPGRAAPIPPSPPEAERSSHPTGEVACPGAQRLSHLVRNTANSPPSISAILSDWRSRVRGVY
jgi:hypothetical protein